MDATLQQFGIPLLVFLAVMCVGGAFLAVAIARRRVLEERLQGNDVFAPAPVQSGRGMDLLNKVGSATSGGKTTGKLARQLAAAGFHSKSAPDVFLGTKVALVVLGLAIVGLLVLPTNLSTLQKFIAAISAGCLLSFVPNLYVHSCRRARTAEIRRTLPVSTDLLEICVSSGMGLDMAWNAVAEEIRRVSPSLADEMALTNLEIQLGAPRPIAMRHMAERTGADELTSLVALLLQSDRFGTSIGDALRMFAGTMREDRTQKAEEAAEKMTVKLLFPMVLFIFPAALIVMVGPAVIMLLDGLAKT
jgi:tight adherence protein C